MRFNSARPIRALTAKEQDGLLKVLFPAEQPEVFTRNRTVDSPDGLRVLNTDNKPRMLTSDEIKVAEPFFGDMIDLGEVRIDDKSWVALLLAANDMVMTIYNTIYGIDIPDDTLIHELVHVWQYSKDHITPYSAYRAHVDARRSGQTDELYYYSVEPRKTFRDYGFEQEAAIVQDAYLVTVKEKPPKRNKDYKSGDPLPKKLYELFMDEFRQWHEELTVTE